METIMIIKIIIDKDIIVVTLTTMPDTFIK